MVYETKEVKKVKDLINHTTNQLGNFPLFYRALLACLSDVISSCYSILLRKFVKTLKMFQSSFCLTTCHFYFICFVFLFLVGFFFFMNNECKNCLLKIKSK